MILSYKKISTLEALSAKENFLSIYKSILVTIDKIKLTQGNSTSIEDHKITVRQTYRSKISHLLNGN